MTRIPPTGLPSAVYLEVILERRSPGIVKYPVTKTKMNCQAPNVSTEIAERYLATTREKRKEIGDPINLRAKLKIPIFTKPGLDLLKQRTPDYDQIKNHELKTNRKPQDSNMSSKALATSLIEIIPASLPSSPTTGRCLML